MAKTNALTKIVTIHYFRHGGTISSLTIKAFQGIFWMATSTAGQGILQLITFTVLARLLKPESFGIITAAQSIILILQVVFQAGLGYSIMQKRTVNKDHLDTSLVLSTFFGIVGYLFLFLLAPSIAKFVNLKDLEIYLKIMGITIIFQSYIYNVESILKRDMNFKKIAHAQIFSYLFSYGLIGVSLAIMDYGTISLAAAFTAQYVVLAIYLGIQLPINRAFRFNQQAAKDLFHLGGNYTVGECLFGLAVYGEKTFVGKFLGGHLLGIYGRAYRIMLLPSSFFGKVVDQVLIPTIAKIQSDQKALRTVFYKGISIVNSSIIPLTAFIFIYAQDIILTVLGPNWIDAVYPVKLLIPAMYFRTCFNVADSFIKGLGLTKARMVNNGIFSFFSIMAGFIGAQYFGMEGACIGIVLAILINYFCAMYVVKRKMNIEFRVVIQKHFFGLLTLVPLAFIFYINKFYIQYLPIHSIFTIIIGLITLIAMLGIQKKLFKNYDLDWIFMNSKAIMRKKAKQ